MNIKSQVLNLKLCMSSFMKLKKDLKWTRIILVLQCFINKIILGVPTSLYILSSHNSLVQNKSLQKKMYDWFLVWYKLMTLLITYWKRQRSILLNPTALHLTLFLFFYWPCFSRKTVQPTNKLNNSEIAHKITDKVKIETIFQSV